MNNLFRLITVAHAQGGIGQIDANFPVEELILRIINWALALGGGIAVIYLVYAGILYTTAGSNEEQAGQAKNTITYAVIGIVVMALAFTVINWLAIALDFTRAINF